MTKSGNYKNSQTFRFILLQSFRYPSSMRFLKNKIIKAREATEKRLQNYQFETKFEDESQPGTLWTIEQKIEESECSYQTRSTFGLDFIKTEEMDQITTSPCSAELSLSQSDEKNSLKTEETTSISNSQYPQIFAENLLQIKLESLKQEDSLNTPVKSEFSESALPKNQKALDKKNQPKKYVKNVDLTYIKAIITFANSHMALPYIKACLQQENLKFTDLISFITTTKDCITNGVQAFWSLFLDEVRGDPKTEACKRIFESLSQVFIDNFSVDWINQSKLVHKEAYLKYRQKMLKKLQSPEHYIQSSKKKL